MSNNQDNTANTTVPRRTSPRRAPPPAAATAMNQARASVSRGGRPRGSHNFSNTEITTLLDLIEAKLPINKNEWEELAEEHYAHYPEKARTVESLRAKFSKLHGVAAPTGATEMPPPVLRAKQLVDDIQTRADSQVDANIDDDTIGLPSEVQVGTDIESSDASALAVGGIGTADTSTAKKKTIRPLITPRTANSSKVDINAYLASTLISREQREEERREEKKREEKRDRERDLREREREEDRDLDRQEQRQHNQVMQMMMMAMVSSMNPIAGNALQQSIQQQQQVQQHQEQRREQRRRRREEEDVVVDATRRRLNLEEEEEDDEQGI